MSRVLVVGLAGTVLIACGGLGEALGAAPPAASPAKGDVISPFDTVRIDGTSAKVDFPRGSSTVLLFFMSGCPSCHRMIPEWNRAYTRRAGTLSVLGVLMDQEPPGFFATVNIAFPVVRSPGRDFLRKLKVTRAPVAIRVAAGGIVEDVAIGQVDGMRVGEIFRP